MDKEVAPLKMQDTTAMGILSSILYLMLAALPSMAQHRTGVEVQCSVERVEAERLPDLHVPRSGHALFVVNGELTAAGGHTTGFVPTPTAEYFKVGRWHVMEMAYSHDDGLCVPLRSGQVLLAGGHNESLGIGQSFSAEMYDPTCHEFRGFGSLSKKRALASGLELDSGRVVIAGNWYHDDGVEIFDGKRGFADVKEVACGRVAPYILRTAPDDAIILGSKGNRDEDIPFSRVDRLRGESFTVPLLEGWRCAATMFDAKGANFVGDVQKGLYRYLIPVADSTGQVAIVQVRGEEFSLLSTTCPVPMICGADSIQWLSHIMADRGRGRAYLCGTKQSAPHRMYVLCIEYLLDVARLTLLRTDSIPDIGSMQPVLTPKGNIALVGGCPGDNFNPLSSVYLLRLVESEDVTTALAGLSWLLLGGGLSVVLLVGFCWIVLHRRKERTFDGGGRKVEVVSLRERKTETAKEEKASDLMQRLRQQMERSRLYLNSELKLADVATAVGVTPRAVSDCINQCEGSSFPQWVNTYRVEHAKQLLLRQPDIKVSALCMESGFSSEATFFRIFKSLTGMTPREWQEESTRKSGF